LLATQQQAYSLHADQEGFNAENITKLSQELRDLYANNTTREQIHSDKEEARKQELVSLLQSQVQREHQVAEKMLAIQQQAYSLHADQDRFNAERVSKLSQELHDLHADYAARELVRFNKEEIKKQELVSLLQLHAQREQEVAEKILALQKQAELEKAELVRLHSEQSQVLHIEHAERETAIHMQWQQSQQELRRVENEHAQRERELFDRTSQIRFNFETNLLAQVQREQEVATQLLTLQQQAQHEIAEQAQRHFEQIQSLRHDQNEREQALSREIALLQNEKQTLHHAQQTLQQQHGFEINRSIEKHNLFIETSTILEQKLRMELQSEQQINLQLHHTLAKVQHCLELTHASFTWRLTAPLRKLTSLIFPKNKTALASSFPQEKIISNLCTASENSHNNFLQTSNESIMNSTIQAIDSHSSSIATSLDELLEHSDQFFISCAYQTLLGRKPDADGMQYYLRRLRKGFSKIQIVTQLRLSQEGKAHDVNLPGLNPEIQRYLRGQYPLIGWLFRLVEGTAEVNSPVERKLRVIEQQLNLFSGESSRRFNQMESALNDLHNLVVQHMQILKTENDELKPTISKVDIDTFMNHSELEATKSLSPQARDIYLRLKVAAATHARRAA
jgi:hypothetical protein